VISLLVTCGVPPGWETEVKQAIRDVVAGVAADEPGSPLYMFHRNKQDPAQMVLLEVYDDEAAALRHNTSSHMALVRSRYAQLFDPSSHRVQFLERVDGTVEA
jgi:quinol monooxygenase YgiN